LGLITHSLSLGDHHRASTDELTVSLIDPTLDPTYNGVNLSST